ncbi:hypothetical protein GCM10009769_25880 [Curtobacterium luteum]|uniref:SD-repeat containing protein B domain-containing protein n=1 Tax=Curtobacterium luteum TaxID=33881 RepID=A0A8H9GD43_9MICO|nr:SdrD B-like domain-containing protein [Curtobacterium luteum]GGL06450.1 hypothetical protein GCM10009769_25880 [Curtobacterium luteum]
MRTRTPFRAALATTAFAAVVASSLVSGSTALAGPEPDPATATATATPTATAAPTTTATATARPTPQPTPSPVPTAERSERAAPTPAAGTASAVALAVEVAKDGNGSFSRTDEPGGDTSDANGIVRTLDAITYRVTVSSNDGDSENERFTLTAPTGTSWATLPRACTGVGSGISGQTLTCNLGRVAEGRAIATSVVLDVSGDLRNGDSIAVDATATADNAANGHVEAASPTTTVSAAARYNLSKRTLNSVFSSGVVGPDGTTEGIQITYPITVDWQPLEPGQGLLGFEKSDGTMRFRDDLSQIAGDLPSGAVLWSRRGACQVHGTAGGNTFAGLPRGTGGGATGVTDSGELTCTQDAPGGDVDVTFTGVVTDPTHLPTKGIDGGALTAPDRAYFAVGVISFWMPNLPEGASVLSTNTFTPLETTSVSGAANFAGSTEPLADNSSMRNLDNIARGSGSKQVFQIDAAGEQVTGSAKKGDPWVAPGQVLRSLVFGNNTTVSNRRYTVCDTFDRSTQTLTKVGGVYASASNASNLSVQYAAFDMTSPMAGRDATCDDEDGPWYSTPAQVPGGPAAVGAVRASGDVRGGQSILLQTHTRVRAVPDGTRVHDFGHVKLGAGPWVHDRNDPTVGAGAYADSVLVTENLVRVGKKIVDTGHDATDTPDETTIVSAGDTVTYALYPSLSDRGVSDRRTDVTVQDVLPVNTSYVPGSASRSPDLDTVVAEDGTTRERLTWTVEDVHPNTTIDAITYDARVSKLTPSGTLTNGVVVSSPSDSSGEEERSAERSVRVVSSGGVGAEKAAVHPVVVTGDDLEWTLGYTNVDATPIEAADLIDVLPYPGDARGSDFHGTAVLAAPVDVDAANGETVRYTAAAPGTVSIDGSHPSNQAGGTTRWCSASEFGTDGCPADLAAATAFRLQRSEPIPVGATVERAVTLHTDGQRHGDRYVNRFGLRASNLPLPVQSNAATIRVVAGSVGDTVWLDANGNGLQDDERTLPGVRARLTGTDDRGQDVDRTTTTDTDGRYVFDELRPGDYTVRWIAPDGDHFTVARVGDDRDADSDADADGVSDSVTLRKEVDDEDRFDGVTRTTALDAGLVEDDAPVDPTDPGDPAGPVTPGTPEPPTDASGAPEPDPGSTPDTHAPVHGTPPVASDARDRLAFTGTEGVSVLVATALLLLLAGCAVSTVRRRAARGRGGVPGPLR